MFYPESMIAMPDYPALNRSFLEQYQSYLHPSDDFTLPFSPPGFIYQSPPVVPDADIAGLDVITTYSLYDFVNN